MKPASIEAIDAFVRRASKDADVEAWKTRYKLTPSESKVLAAAVDGRGRSELADGRSSVTVKSHVRNLLAKTGDTSLLAASTRLLRERR